MSHPRTTNTVPSSIETAHPDVADCQITFPRTHVLLVTIDRAHAMNCLPVATTIALGALWRWYDAEPGLRCAVFTGAGTTAFCAGMDLKERLAILDTKDVSREYPAGQFAGMTNRTGRKPIVVACNGHAHGEVPAP